MEKGSSSSTSLPPVPAPAPAAAAATNSLNGLAFGKKIYFQGPKPPTPPPPSPSAKKGRIGTGTGTGTGLLQGGQPPRCQVEGCKVDLSDAKVYYSRHKVCALHSKTPTVIVAGLQQRFCQQCSRFHQLPEFDQGKRSCRRRLAGHNERRRKPQPGSLLPPYYGSSYPPIPILDKPRGGGGFMMDFSAYPGRDTWPNNQSAATWQSNSEIIHHHHQGSASVAVEECFSGVSDSSRALSLLSNKPARSPTTQLPANEFLTTGGGNGSVTTLAHPPPINNSNDPGQFAAFQSWGFKGNEIPPADMQFSHPTTNTEYGGLGQPNELQFHEPPDDFEGLRF